MKHRRVGRIVWMKNWEGCGRKRSWHIMKYYTDIHVNGSRKIRINVIEDIQSWVQDSSPMLSHEICRPLWKPKDYCRLHKTPLLLRRLGHINPIHTVPSNFFNVHFNIIVSEIKFSEFCFLRAFQKKIFCLHFPSPHTCFMYRTFHIPLINYATTI